MKTRNLITICAAILFVCGNFIFNIETSHAQRDVNKKSPTPAKTTTPKQSPPVPTNSTNPNNPTVTTKATPKKRLAIIAFENLARKDLDVNWDVGSTMASLLAYELGNERVYDLVDYTKETSLKELQDKSLGGRFSRDTALQIGKLKSANVAAVGQVIDFSIQETSSQDYLGRKTYTKIGVVTIIITLYDIQTGELIGSAKAKGTSPPQISKSGLGAGIWGIGKDGKTVEVITSSNWQQTSMNEAASDAIKKIVQLLLGFDQTGQFGDKGVGLQPREIKGEVADYNKKTKKAILTITSYDGVKVGDVFKIIRQGKCTKNPTTGEILKCEENEVAQIKITESTDKYSEGEVISGGEIKKKDIAVKKVE